MPTDSPLTLIVLAAARRETFGAVQKPSPPNNATAAFQQLVYTPIHNGTQAWIDSDLGQHVSHVINTVAGSYVIGDGADGTAANPDGGAAGWLLGDGGDGFNSTLAGIAGGNGGAAGFFGNGGAGGMGGTGAAGGGGGTGGGLMGIGGAGGTGGTGAAGAVGGAGGAGGAAKGLVFGVGGAGGDGGDGTNGGRGGNGGDGAAFLGSGGDGGDAGHREVGGAATGLPALGGAGGTAGWLGSHGAVGRFSTSVGSSGPAPQTSAGSLPPLSSTGTWLTNSDGQVIILHGVNQVYKVAPYEPAASGFDDEDAEFLAANGFNVVRLGVIWTAVEPEPGVIDYEYLDSINDTIDTLAAHGIYTIVDMHQDNYSETFAGEGAPGWATQTGGRRNLDFGFPGSYFLNPAENYAWDAFWGNAAASDGAGLQDHYAQTWQAVASYVGNDPAVIGYDIINEPWPGTPWVVAFLGGAFFANQQLTPMYNQVGAAIRSVDPSTTLYVEPGNPGVTEVGNILGVPVMLGAIDDPNIVLAFHNYCGGFGKLCPVIAGALADGARDYALQHNIPAFMNEFGATGDTAELTDEMLAADQYHMSWAVWAYTAKGDITTSDTTGEQALVYDPALPPIGDNVNTSNLKTLAAPYPQVISGTPQAWSWTDGTFQFSYSTARVDGTGNFAAGSRTTISVPEVEFPDGYQVTVTGGHVVSAPNAPHLIVESDTGATTVSVVVTGNAADLVAV